MSLFVSSFLPNGNYLIAADTRVSQHCADGAVKFQQDGAKKITPINDHTFVFMSGSLFPCELAVREYKRLFSEEKAKDLLIQLARALVDGVCNPYFVEASRLHTEAAVFFLIQATGGRVKTGLYMWANNYVPIECDTLPGGVVVLGSCIPNTADKIRDTINSAHTYDEIIQAYREVYNSQCRAEVGGNLEMYELSPAEGFVKQIKYKIKEANSK